MRKIDLLPDGNVRVTVSLHLRCVDGRTRIQAGNVPSTVSSIAIQIARAFRWQKYIDDGRFGNAAELARFLGYDSALTARILRLTRLSPRIIHAALANELPENINLETLFHALPTVWKEQEEILGFPPLP